LALEPTPSQQQLRVVCRLERISAIVSGRLPEADFPYQPPDGRIADYSGSGGLTRPNVYPRSDAITRHMSICELHAIEIRFPASRMVERSQVWAASVFILGSHDIRYLNVLRTAGAFRIFLAGFDASCSAMRRGTVATRFASKR
jgi:hypothetical protein